MSPTPFVGPMPALTRAVIGAFYDVYNELGYGFLESVYASALAIVLTERGIPVEREPVLDVTFHGQLIGCFRADMVVDGRVVLELKAAQTLPEGAKSQLLNYLRVSGLQVGLLLPFGPAPVVKRAISPSGGWIDQI